MKINGIDIVVTSLIALIFGILVGRAIDKENGPKAGTIDYGFTVLQTNGHQFAVVQTAAGLAMAQIIEQDVPAFNANTIVERAGVIAGDWLMQAAPPGFDYTLYSNRWFEDYGIASRMISMPGSSNLILFRRR